MLEIGKYYKIKPAEYFFRNSNTSKDGMLIKSEWKEKRIPGFNRDMLKYCGRYIKITEKSLSVDQKNTNNFNWYWNESFLIKEKELLELE